MLYDTKEMISEEFLSLNTKNIIQNLKDGVVEKFAVFEDNEPQVVMLSFKEYEIIKQLAERIENEAIAKIIDERMPNGVLENPISHDELLKRLKKRGRNV